MLRARSQHRVTDPLVGVLALQGDVREHLRAFTQCGVEAIPVRQVAELARIDALALPGGESTTMSRLLQVFGLEDPLRQRLDAGLPCFATCAGLILLSRTILDGRPDQVALGVLDIAVRRNGFGRQVDSFEADVQVRRDPTPFHAMFIRAPRIEHYGAAVEVVAEHHGEVVAVQQGRHLGMCFHPEMGHDQRLHRRFLTRAGLLAEAAA